MTKSTYLTGLNVRRRVRRQIIDSDDPPKSELLQLSAASRAHSTGAGASTCPSYPTDAMIGVYLKGMGFVFARSSIVVELGNVTVNEKSGAPLTWRLTFALPQLSIRFNRSTLYLVHRLKTPAWQELESPRMSRDLVETLMASNP
jgi:hypothetical protein